MATSTIKVYAGNSDWKLYANKLFLVEDIESYLSYFTPSYIITGQYIKHELELGITLAIPQMYSEELAGSPIYVSIKNSDSSKTYYYYVKERVWRSKEALRLELVLDVLNTFKENTDYVLKDNCNIQREHKDRYNLTNRSLTLDIQIDSDSGYVNIGDRVGVVYDGNTICEGILESIGIHGATITILSDETTESIQEAIQDWIDAEDLGSIAKDVSNYILCYATAYDFNFRLFRNIDYIPENINPVLQCGDTEGTKIEKSSPLNVDWYLLYRNVNEPDDKATSNTLVNPVDCYLLPKESREVSIGLITDGRVTASTLETGKFYYVNVNNSDGVTLSNGITLNSSHGANYINARRIEIFKNADGSLTVTFFGRASALLGEDP